MPLNCKQCDHKKNPDGGHCYMFRTQPTAEYCAQFRPGDTVKRRILTLKDISKMGSQPKVGC
jgi:hypothetical protein